MRRTTHLGNTVFVFLGWVLSSGAMVYFGMLTSDVAVAQVVGAVGGAIAFWFTGDRVRKPRAGEAA
jgi:membrane associated rhomboid family serine protease